MGKLSVCLNTAVADLLINLELYELVVLYACISKVEGV